MAATTLESMPDSLVLIKPNEKAHKIDTDIK